MGRVIKFRAWDLDHKWMEDSFFLQACNGIAHDTPSKTYDTPNTEIEENPSLVIMQFIGLQDINGKDIYEGDILHQLDPVIWNPFSVYYCADSGCYLAGGTLSSRVIKDVELVVVGNIYENPNYMSDGK